MRALPLPLLVVLACTGCSSEGSDSEGRSGPQPIPSPHAAGDCGLDLPAFCETFDNVSPGGRGGDVDETVWSVARWQGSFPVWTRRAATTFNPYFENNTLYHDMEPSNAPPTFCGAQFDGILPPDDFRICDGALSEVFGDAGGLPVNALRTRQPFDFTDRTGTVVFDVDAKRTTGDGFDGHTWWLEVWITEDPVPIPYHGAPTLGAYTERGAVGIQILPHGPCKTDVTRNIASRFVVMNGYRILRDDLFDDNPPERDCFKVSDGRLNHFELRISRNRLEVWVSDYDAPDKIRLGAATGDLDLPFSRGYLHLMHVHYNAGKNPDSQGRHPSSNQTFRWDNIGFDGPTYPTPKAYDIADDDGVWEVEQQPAMTLGWQLTNNGAPAPVSFTIPDLDVQSAASATLNFNAMVVPGDQISFRLNKGEWRPFEVPSFGGGDHDTQLGRALTMAVPLTDLVQGKNTLDVKQSAGEGAWVGNIDITTEMAQ